MDWDKIQTELDNLSLTDIDRHRKALAGLSSVVRNPVSNAPVMLLDAYVKLTETIEGYRVKNPKIDLSIYDNALNAMRAVLIYCESIGEIYRQNEYLETMVQTQSQMIGTLQNELMQWNGIQAAIYNGTLSEKINTILAKK